MMKAFLVSLALLVSEISAVAQSTATTAPTKNTVVAKKKPHPSYASIEDVEGLPHVLLIGDSISMGYTLTVRSALKGKANVHRPAANCGPTDIGLKYIDKWLGEKKWDLIHFNWGLHDVMHYLNSVAKEDRVPHTDKGAFRRNSPEQYETKLRELVAKLEATRATLIWASTTPIPESSTGMWKPGDSAIYNKIAAQMMKEKGILINDLWAFTEPKLVRIQNPSDVHFSSKGSAAIGAEVARFIEKTLNER